MLAEYHNGSDTRDVILNVKEPVFALPADLPAGSSAAEQRIWEKKIYGIAKLEDILESNLRNLYALIWGQCSELVSAHVEASTGFVLVASSSDSLALLQGLRKEAFSFHFTKYQQLAKHEAKRRLYHLSQDKTTSDKALKQKGVFTTLVKTRPHLTRLFSTDLQTLLIL